MSRIGRYGSMEVLAGWESSGGAKSGLCKYTLISIATSGAVYVTSWLRSPRVVSRSTAVVKTKGNGPQKHSDEGVHNVQDGVQDGGERALKITRAVLARKTDRGIGVNGGQVQAASSRAEQSSSDSDRAQSAVAVAVAVGCHCRCLSLSVTLRFLFSYPFRIFSAVVLQ